MYRLLAIMASALGIGLFLGYSLGNGTSNTPVWLAGLSVLAGGVLLGMSLTSPSTAKPTEKDRHDEA